MNTGFTERSPPSQASFIQLSNSSDKDPHAADVSDPTRQHQQSFQQQHSRTLSQSQTYHPQLSAPTTLHPPAAGAVPSSPSMYQVQHQPRAPAYPSSHHYLPPSQQAPSLQAPQAFHASHHLHPQAQQQAYVDGQQQLQRGANQGLSVPRSINTSAWSSTSNAPPSVQLHITPTSNNAGVSSAPLSSSSSGSLMSYWEQGAVSDGEPGMMASSSAMPEMMHSRFASSAASLPAMSPTGAHPSSSSYVSGSANSHSYLGTASESHHHYRPPTALSINSGMSTQHYAPTSSGLPYPVSNPLPSPGFMYSPSSASSSVPGYDAYPSSSSGFPTQHSQYVSYLPPAMGADSRGFYPLNPFEIKHRRRTTKTQFRVLESTFREIPKPNAALRKQISAQLDMPVRAVQIWFQNRRAKAKAVEKKRPAQGQGEERQRGQERYEEARGTGRSMDLPPLRIPNDAVSRQESYASGSSNVTLPSLAGSGSATLRERRAMAGASVTNPAYAEYADRTSALEESTLSAGMPDRNRAAYQRDPRGFDERYRSSS